MEILVTGIGGLVGSNVARFFCSRGYRVVGIENNTREALFGKQGGINLALQKLLEDYEDIKVINADIRDRNAVSKAFKEHNFTAVVHCAGQPSHDFSVQEPEIDFSINVVGTFNLLEEYRCHAPESKFIFLSTNKVYGDFPNTVEIIEEKTRFKVIDDHYINGFHENTPIDQSNHTPFGAHKAAADLMVQEYSNTYNLSTVCLRAGCITGKAHSGVELHGFLSYLVKCAKNNVKYKIYGYSGKQVRDNVCASDVANLIFIMVQNGIKSNVYNVGGGAGNAVSIVEVISLLKDKFSIELNYEYVDKPRWGDHISYISDLSKIQKDYPEWSISKSIEDILKDIIVNG